MCVKVIEPELQRLQAETEKESELEKLELKQQ